MVKIKNRCLQPLYKVEFFKIINITGDKTNNKLNNNVSSNLLFQKVVLFPKLSILSALFVNLTSKNNIEITIKKEKGIDIVPSTQTGI